MLNRRASAFAVLMLLEVGLVVGSGARAAHADETPAPVEATLWQSVSFGANASAATQTGGSITADIPLPVPEDWLKSIRQPRIGAELAIVSQPEAAFNFSNVETFGQALHFEVNLRLPVASSDEGSRRYTLSLYGAGGFTTLLAGVDAMPRQRYAREWELGLHIDAPNGAWIHTGIGHSDVVTLDFKPQWIGGAQTPVPSVDALKIGVRFAVNILNDPPGPNPKAFDNAIVYVGADVVKAIGALVD
jgi:hypothetical protein